LLRKNGKKNRHGWRSPNRLLLNPPLIYAEKRKSETDLQKIVKIMGELLKIKKNEKDTFSHAQSPKKRNKKQKQRFNEF
jgi:hypothetical protein